jgi:hypothetical protein
VAPITLLPRRALRRMRAALSGNRLSPTAPAVPAPGFPSFVICGVEHSGTTLLSDVFRQVPGLGSGFETGVLLADAPADFPHTEHFQDFAENWGLGPGDVAFLCAAPDLETFYRRLAQRAGTTPPDTVRIFDKTPRYLVALKDVLGRVPCPFIATYKDPRAILHSTWVRQGRPPILPWLDGVHTEQLGYLQSLYEQHQTHCLERRVLFMPLERLCLQAGHSCEMLFDHVGIPFDPGYLVLRGIDNRATHGGTILVGTPFAYRRDWPRAACRAVERQFAALDRWFYA